MGSFSIAHWAIVALVVLILFGPGKISQTFGDFGKGIAAFRKGLRDETAKDQETIDSSSADRAVD